MPLLNGVPTLLNGVPKRPSNSKIIFAVKLATKGTHFTRNHQASFQFSHSFFFSRVAEKYACILPYPPPESITPLPLLPLPHDRVAVLAALPPHLSF